MLSNLRKEVMLTLGNKIEKFTEDYLIKPEEIWQPTDFLPNPQGDTFMEEVQEIRELSKDLSDDFWTVLVGDMITEEALPTYEAWLLQLDGIEQNPDNPWAKWIRQWTSEENRHGDVLNKYIYLSGRVNMREVEITTQHLIADGFDIGTSYDPYKNFVYTTFQELATYVSHNNVAKLARKGGMKALAKMSKIIAGDEMRHHNAYSTFVKNIFELDPSEMMIAFRDMMRHKIVMPALHLRESFADKGTMFEDFSTVAQRIGVYTGEDYINILKKLNTAWDIENIRGLTEEAEKARDYLLKLPERMERVTSRLVVPDTDFKFKWMNPAI
jgi:acyl-[acyl-carrier-protein] desaturase